MAPTSVENASKSLEEINNDNVEQNTMSSFTCSISTTEHEGMPNVSILPVKIYNE